MKNGWFVFILMLILGIGLIAVGCSAQTIPEFNGQRAYAYLV